MKKETKSLKTLFEDSLEKSKNLYFTHSGHDSARDAYISGIYSLYKEMFGSYPYEFAICQFVEPVNSFDRFSKADFKFAAKYINGYKDSLKLDYIGTLQEIIKKNEGYSYVVSMGGVNMIILWKYIVYWCQESSFSILCPECKQFTEDEYKKCDKIHFINFMLCGNVWDGEFKINDYIVWQKGKKMTTKPTYKMVIHTAQGFDLTDFPICDKININLEENYNDDLPYDKICTFLNQNDESGLMIFRGDPGTGKTYFIRHLISNFKKHHFLVLSESCLAYINDPSFIKMLMKFENSIVILEDCEKVLMERQRGGNELISTLLNITSGLLGDSLKVRVIATFNAPVDNVDKALLRKGRMKVDYEFGKLSKEKTYALGKKLGKDVKEGESLTLAEIYNYDEENSFRKEKKTIGFAK